MFCITADSVYYGFLSVTLKDQDFENANHFISTLLNPLSVIDIRAKGSLIVTPINNLLYNTNMNNLQQHGIHPRYTHLTVNLPLLFGPLIVQTFFESPSVFKRGTSGPNTRFFWLLISIVLTSVVGLSIVPHQEARFLCPLLLPLVLIYTWKQPRLSTSFWITWVLFNVITTYVFGVVHQGGVVPVMRFLNYQTSNIHGCYVLKNEDLTCGLRGEGGRHFFLKKNYINQSIYIDNFGGYNITTNLVFYKTYMPPQHLLVKPSGKM